MSTEPQLAHSTGLSRVLNALRSPLIPYALLSVAVAALLMAPLMTRGWFHHDEGMLGQTAERVLLGEVPHRDFDEPYTGLITYWHALAFKLGGVKLATLRWWFFAPILAWVFAVHRIAVRFVPGLVAVAVTTVCLLWGVSNWATPMASWFNLFLGTAGALFLLRWQEDRRSRWLVMAGVAGGLSFLAKLSGVFFVFGAGLALLYLTSSEERPEGSRSRGGLLLVSLGLAAVLLVLFVPFARSGVRELMRYWLPLLAICAGLLLREARHGATLSQRLREVWAWAWPLVLGLLAVVMPWGVFLAVNGALEPTLVGVFITPFRRLEGASRAPPSFTAFLSSALMLLYLLPRRTRREQWMVGLFGAFVMALLFVGSGTESAAYRFLWFLGWGVPYTVAAVTAALAAHSASAGNPAGKQWRDGAVVLGCVSAAMLLLEYPFAAPIYTLFVLPMSLLAACALYRVVVPRLHLNSWVLLAFFLVFGLFRLRPANILTVGVAFVPSADKSLMDVPRSGLYVEPGDSVAIRRLVERVQQFPAGTKLWAGPEAPELYFLTGMRNSTRVIFEVLATDSMASKTLAERAIASGATVVVLKPYAQFTKLATAEDIAALQAHFGRGEVVDRYLMFYK